MEKLIETISIWVRPIHPNDVGPPPTAGFYVARSPDIPEYVGIGRSPANAVDNLRYEIGKNPSASAKERERDVLSDREYLEQLRNYALDRLRVMDIPKVVPFKTPRT